MGNKDEMTQEEMNEYIERKLKEKGFMDDDEKTKTKKPGIGSKLIKSLKSVKNAGVTFAKGVAKAGKDSVAELTPETKAAIGAVAVAGVAVVGTVLLSGKSDKSENEYDALLLTTDDDKIELLDSTPVGDFDNVIVEAEYEQVDEGNMEPEEEETYIEPEEEEIETE